MASENGTLQLAGLAPSVTEGLLLNMFRTYGPILRTAITSSGSAHVVFARGKNALKAAQATNGSVVAGQRITVAVMRKFRKTNRPCRSFQVGVCRQGDSCKYLHVGTSGDGVAKVVAKPVAIPVVATAAAAKARAVIRTIPDKKICQYFRRAGKCLSGAECRFAHILDSELEAAQRALPDGSPSTGLEPAAKKTPCQFFASGLCTRGDACRYSHAVSAPPAAATPATKSTKERKATVAPSATTTAAVAIAEPQSSRACVECEQDGAVQWQCSKCDGALYCDACDALVHQSKVMRSHERAKLAPLLVRAENPTCDECEESESSVRCEQCAVVLCASCDASVHKFKSLRSHVRAAVSSAAAAPVAAATAAKETKAAAAPVEPALKKQKVNTSAAGVVTTKITYVDSVPKFDLSSESESESDAEQEASEMEVDSAPAAANAKPTTSVAAPKIKYVESVPKYELSSESESESDSEDDEPQQAKSQQAKSQQAKPVSTHDDIETEDDAPPAVAASAPAHNGDISSESSDDEDERPIVLPASPVRTVAALKPVRTVSSSSESSDDEDEKPRIAPALASLKRAAASSSSSDSDSSSSSDDDNVTPAPVRKTPAPAPVKKALAPVIKRVPVKPNRGSANPGISTGSSHSLVKKIEAYCESGSTVVLHLDANLNGFERLLAHDCAERLGLQHVSVGEGLERHITISNR